MDRDSSAPMSGADRRVFTEGPSNMMEEEDDSYYEEISPE
jgi:hypothetical protein